MQAGLEAMNYHHLFYFWHVARLGSVTRASEELGVAQPTISAQLKQLEGSLNVRLFARSGRNIVLTDAGRVACQYANEIFALGGKLRESLNSAPDRPMRFVVGIADALPKLIAYVLLKPALALNPPVSLVCEEDKPEGLLADLSVHRLDLVLSEIPASPGVKVRAYSHLLGECGVTLFGVEKLAAKYRPGFPQSLASAPLLLPTDNSMQRRRIDQWFSEQPYRPVLAGEFQDGALMQTFGGAGMGLFPAPSAIEEEVCRQFRVSVVGRLPGLREQYYALSVERRLKHPAVAAIAEAARKQLFVREGL